MTKHEEREQLHERIQAQSIIETYTTMISACYKLSRSSRIPDELKKAHAQEGVNFAKCLLAIMKKNNEQA